MKCTLLGSGIAVVVVILVAACGSSSTGTSSSSATTTTASSSTPAPTAAADLSGTWSGQAIGVDGTHAMRITWQQSGSNLSGKITFSNPTNMFNINGTVHGSTIRFSTVGFAAITFAGSVSGNSMSGSFQEAASSGGSWHASKTS